MEAFVIANWGIVGIAIMWILRITKTSTKLTMFKKDADTPEVVAAAKASLTLSPDQAKIAALEAKVAELTAATPPTGATPPKA